MKKILFFTLFVLMCPIIKAQLPETATIDSIRQHVHKLYDNAPDSLKKILNSRVEELIDKFLQTTRSIGYRFDSLKFLKVVAPDDNAFRLLTWVVPLSDGSFLYSGYLQMSGKKNVSGTLFKLVSLTGEPDVFSSYSCENWPGAVYYKMIGNRTGKVKCYTLFGWMGSEPGTTQRIIETLYFDESGSPVFGKQVFFNVTAKPQNRIIFRYTDQMPFQLAYEKQLVPGSKKKKQDMIVFNRLAGSKPEMGIRPGTMVPDYSTFDGFIFKKGSWIFIEDIDARMPAQKKQSVNPPAELELSPSHGKK